MKTFKSYKRTSTGVFFTGDCFLGGILLGTDGANDPTITVYEGTDNSGTEILPTTTFDASALGLNGYVGVIDECTGGVYIEITCAGTVEVTAKIRAAGNWKMFR